MPDLHFFIPDAPIKILIATPKSAYRSVSKIPIKALLKGSKADRSKVGTPSVIYEFGWAPGIIRWLWSMSNEVLDKFEKWHSQMCLKAEK